MGRGDKIPPAHFGNQGWRKTADLEVKTSSQTDCRVQFADIAGKFQREIFSQAKDDSGLEDPSLSVDPELIQDSLATDIEDFGIAFKAAGAGADTGTAESSFRGLETPADRHASASFRPCQCPPINAQS